MELSVFIARIVAVIYLAASLGGFINPKHYRRWCAICTTTRR